MRNHALLLRMRLMLLDADQVRHSKIRKLLEIPWILFIAAHIDLAEAVKGCNTELVWGKAHNGAVLMVSSIDRARLEASPAFPPYPCWEEGSGEVGIWNFGEGRDQGGDDDILVG